MVSTLDIYVRVLFGVNRERQRCDFHHRCYAPTGSEWWMVVLWYFSLVLVGGFTMYAAYNDVPPLYAIGAMLVWMVLSFVLFRCPKCGLPGLLGYEAGSAIPCFPRLPGATCARCETEL